MDLENLPTYAFWTRTDRDTIAAVAPDGAETSVGELLDAANQIARNLQAMGIGRGDTVGYCLHNSVAVLEIMLATQQIGVYVVPCNWHLTADETTYILDDSAAKIVIVHHDLITLCAGSSAKKILVGGDKDGYAALKSGSTEPPENRSAGATMTYTSGTTGQPKGVRRPLPEGTPEAVASSYALFMTIYTMKPGEGVHLVGSPLYHTAVVYFAVSTLHLGHKVVIMDKWTAQGMLEFIQKYKVTNSHMVPTQFSRLLAFDKRKKYKCKSVQQMVHGAAPCPRSVKEAMLEWWGNTIYEYYAASEGGGTIVSPEEWLERPGTVGRPWPTAEIAVFDDDGEPMKVGKVGTVYIKMQQGFEYHGDKEKTAEGRRSDGFFTVGDAGYMDEDGYLFLSDRKVDMIISGGVNIYPAEIESALCEHPRIVDAAVFGIPDKDWGEQVKAVIELKGMAGIGEEAQMLAWARSRIASYKCPRSIDFVKVMPREENGKLNKRRLRDPYWADTGRQI